MSIEKLSAILTVEIEKDQAEKELERLRSPKAIKMAMDVSDAKLQLQTLRKEYDSLSWAMKRSDMGKALGAQIQQQAREVTILGRNLNNFVRTGDKDLSAFGRAFQKLGIDINNGFGKSIVNATESLGGMVSKLGSLVAGGAILAGLTKLATTGALIADKFDQANISFGVMLGGSDKAKSFIQDLTTLAAQSPTLDLFGIQDTAKQLLAFGVDSQSIVGTIKMLGDISAATGTELSRLGYAYGQVRTAGQLYGTELRQFTEAGVPLLAELAKMYGVTERQVKKMVEDGKIGFNDVQSALQNLTKEGGKMGGMMEKQAETFSGKVAKMKDSINIFLAEFGVGFKEIGKVGADAITTLFTWFRAGFFAMQKVTVIFTALVIDRWLAIKDTFFGVVTFLKKFGVIWTAIWQQFGDNVFTLVENIGIAFDNMPAYLQRGLNKGLQVINGFVNKAGDMLNGFTSFFNENWKPAGTVDFKLDFAGPEKAYKEFSTAIVDGASSQIDALDKSREANRAYTKEMQDLNSINLMDELSSMEDSRKAREIDYTMKKIQNEGIVDDAKKTSSALSKAEKEREKLAKENIQRQKKLFQDMNDRRNDELKSINDYIKKLKDAIKDIADIEKDIANVGTDAQKQITSEVGNRYRDLLEQQKQLQADLLNAQNETAGTAYLPDPSIQKNLDSTIAQIKELESSGLLDQNTKAREQQRASLSSTDQQRFDFQQKLGDIAIEKANKEAELQRKKADIEAELGLKKSQAEQELIIQEERKAKNERAIKKYEEIINLIEKGITDNTQKEIDKRMSLYAQEEQRLLRLIELRMAAGYAVGAITPAQVTNTVNNNPQVTVNANVANSVDVNTLANTLARKIQLSSKGIS